MIFSVDNKIKRLIITKIKYPEKRPFNPSIKFAPFIKTKKQHIVNIKLKILL